MGGKPVYKRAFPVFLGLISGVYFQGILIVVLVPHLTEGNEESQISKVPNVSSVNDTRNEGVGNESTILTNWTRTVELFQCPGSNLSLGSNGGKRFSKAFLAKYGFEFKSEPDNFELLARFTETHPECSTNSLVESVQGAMSSGEGGNNDHLDLQFLFNGWILKELSAAHWESIPPTKYCIESWDNDNFTIKYCRSDCVAQPCISKCCFEDEVCDLKGERNDGGCNKCVKSGPEKWRPIIEGQLKNSDNYTLVHYDPPCPYIHYTLHKDSTNFNFSNRSDFKLLQNGSVAFYRDRDDTWVVLPKGTYCVDGAVDSSSESRYYSGDSSDMVFHVCRSQLDVSEWEIPKERQFIVYTILVPFGLVFVSLTIIVYILTWSEQNIHGYSNFSYLVSLLALYIFVVLGNVRTFAYRDNYPTLCAFIAGSIHFTYLSSACWVTCISYDVWRQFHKMNNVRVQSSGRRRFIRFCLFSVGYPLVQVGFCAMLDALFRKTPLTDIHIILPNYGRLGLFACTMSNDGITYYLYIPISILIVFNMGFFIATILDMKRHKKSIRAAFAEVSRSARPSKANQSFGIYTRLFIIMGIFWISQIISWFVDMNNGNDVGLGYDIVFAIIDTITVLQAVAIFYIFVCKRSVFVNLWKLHPWFRPFLRIWVKVGCCAVPSAADILKSSHRSTSAALPRSLSTKFSKNESSASTSTTTTTVNNKNVPNRSSTESTSSGTDNSQGKILPDSKNGLEMEKSLTHHASLCSDDASYGTEVSELDEVFKFSDKRTSLGGQNETKL